jgi:hypothetical protein
MDLADGQGGSGNSSAHAQLCNVNKTDRVVEALERQIGKFSEATKNIKTLTEAVASIRKDVNHLKRKNNNEHTDGIQAKQSKTTTSNPSVSGTSHSGREEI